MRKRKGEWITVSLSLAALVAIGGSQSIVAAQEISSTYVVQSGDTLYSIASRHGLSLGQLKEINGLNNDIILPGQSLLVSQSEQNEEISTPSNETQNSNNTEVETNTPPVVSNNTNTATATGSTYTVKSGDSLYAIAVKHGVSVQNIKDWNGLTSNYIYSGDVLNVSKEGTPAPKPTPIENDNNNSTGNTSTTNVHIVKAGESVNLIAQKYGVTAAQIKSWNKLSSNLIHPGDRLVVSASAKNNGNSNSGNSNNDSENTNNSGNTESAKTYTVKSGDYLYSIASRFGVTVQNLKDWSKLSNNYIYSGDVLNVAKPGSNTSTPAPKPDDNINNSNENSGTKKVHVVKAGEWVSKIAAQYGITDQQLKSWNNLSTNLIHPGDRLVVSNPNNSGNSNTGNESDNESNKPETTTAKTHTVISGDYLYSIASRYGISVQNLKDWNKLTSNYIYSGDVLVVSKPNSTTPAPKPDNKEEEKEEKEENNNTNKPSKVHVVKSGEWVSKIANQYGITEAQLREWNNLSSNLIHPGDRLVVSKPSNSGNNSGNNGNNDNNNKPSTPAKTYTVKSGDYLYKIASAHGITVENLKDWNNLTSNYLYSGDVLIVSKPTGSNNGGNNNNNSGSSNQSIPDLSGVTPVSVNYDVKLNGTTQALRNTLSYAGRTHDVVDYFGQRFTVKREFVKGGTKYIELLNSNGSIVGYVPKSASVDVPQGKNVVYLDAGHGGTETGSASNNRKEKDLNLNITSQLSTILRNQGYIVYESRTYDETIPLHERHLEPNSIMPDAYISVHHNAMPIPNTAHGIVTLYHDQSIDEKGYETVDHHIGTDIIPEGKRLANAIQNSLVAITGANDMGTRAQNLHVTRKTDVPATLVELGFQDHDAEFRKLINPSYQKKLINGLVNGINAYFGLTR